MQLNAASQTKYQDDQHTNKKSVIAVLVSLHPTHPHLKSLQISDLSPSVLEAHSLLKKGIMTALQRRFHQKTRSPRSRGK